MRPYIRNSLFAIRNSLFSEEDSLTMPKKFVVLFSLCLLLLAAVSGAQAAGPGDKLDFASYVPEITDYTLPNGLRVILAEDHSAPVVAVDIWYRVGGANDPENRSGFAHLFEHMMFKGSANIKGDEFDKLLEQVGANNNAYTVTDNTAYWEVAPANELPRVLWLESDRMASLNVSEEAFTTQRDVVIEEFGQRVANAPYGVSNRRLFTLPMQGYAPYERSVIGNVADLQAATLAEVRSFHDKYYKPNNATLVIVGDINVEQTKTLVQAYFGDIPAGPPVTPITKTYPLPAEFPALRTDAATGCAIGYEETLIDPLVKVPRFAATVIAPPRGSPDFYALSLLTDILSGGDSSRYEQNIIRTGEAAAAYTGLADYLGASILYSIGFPNSGDTQETVQTLLRREIDKIIADGVTQTELDRVQKQKLADSITGFRDSVRSTAEWLQDATLTFGDPKAMIDEMGQYQAVTPADIQRVAKDYFCTRPTTTLVTLPEGKEVLAKYPGELVQPQPVKPEPSPAAPGEDPKLTAEQLAALPKGVVSRTSVPASLPVTDSGLPPFETFKLDNGLEVIYVQRDEVPKINLSLYVGGSDAALPANQQGLADFMAELLTKGTKTRTAADIAQSIEAAGGSVGSNASLEWTSLSASALSTDVSLPFDILADMAINSTFPDKELEVVREQTLTFLAQDEVDPDTLANRQFGRIAYGGHPYGYYMTEDSINGITQANVVDFFNTYYKPNNALLVIVGDLSLAEAKAQTERVFGTWQSGNVPDYLAYPRAKLGDTSMIYLIDRPDSEQATIQVGNRAINAKTPERYALSIVNAVLGGGSSSRLYQNLREAKGYTYGVYSRFGQPNDTSTFRVLTDVDQAHAADAIREILAELKQIRTEDISAAELKDAKGLLIGNFALAIEDPADFAGQLSTRYLTGVPIDELNSYLQKLNAVTAAQARAAAEKYIDSDQPIIVVVGKAEVVKPQLEELGKVVMVDKDGKVVSGQ
ncbi:MAG: hypothetical protein FOGNACKC_00383 [Anaerolineae bacterium]|nr:hypothetical protein [Anaerolineae bacterium]